jgi:hypothetical protein
MGEKHRPYTLLSVQLAGHAENTVGDEVVGWLLGDAVLGSAVGAIEGLTVGLLGDAEGLTVGLLGDAVLGSAVGSTEGLAVKLLGWIVGTELLGLQVEVIVGLKVVGMGLGLADGAQVGILLGFKVGDTLGFPVETRVGDIVGDIGIAVGVSPPSIGWTHHTTRIKSNKIKFHSKCMRLNGWLKELQ